MLTSTEATPPWPLAGGRMADIAQAAGKTRGFSGGLPSLKLTANLPLKIACLQSKKKSMLDALFAILVGCRVDQAQVCHNNT